MVSDIGFGAMSFADSGVSEPDLGWSKVSSPSYLAELALRCSRRSALGEVATHALQTSV
jgi:hypothetical protein